MLQLLAVSILAPPQGPEPAEAHLHLRYRAVHERTADGSDVKAAEPLPARDESSFEIVLGRDAVQITEGETVTLYDFVRERLLDVDPEGHTFHQRSLLAIAAFRARELEHRIEQHEALSKAGLAAPAFEPFELETLLGCSTGSERVIDSEVRDGAQVFVVGGEEVVRCAMSGMTLAPHERRALARFLFYRGRLHPRIRAEIAARGEVPELLAFRYRNVGVVDDVRYELEDATRTERGPIDVSGFQRKWDDDSALAAAAERALADAEPDLDLEARAAEAREEGRYLDAVLALLELGLRTGAQPARQLRAVLSAAAGREAAGQLLAGLQAIESEPERALELLVAVDRSALRRPRVLDVFRANAMANAGRSEEARALLLEVVATHPEMTAVYKDLGDLYLRAFDTQSAWLCWNVGRALVPDHPIFEPVARREEELRARFADVL